MNTNDKIPDKWNYEKINNYIEELKSGLSRQLSDYDLGIPVVRSNNLVNQSVDFDNIKYWYIEDPQGADVSNYLLKDGDILINFINSIAQIGKCGRFKNTIGRDVIYTTNLLRLRLNEKISSEYFLYFTETSQFAHYIMLITKPAVNQASFTTKDFAKMEMLVPPIKEQKKISKILETWDSTIELYEELVIQKQLEFKAKTKLLLSGKKRLGIFHQSWNKRPLSDYLKECKKKSTIQDQFPIITSSRKGIYLQEDYFNKSVASKNNIGYKVIRLGQFTYRSMSDDGSFRFNRLDIIDKGIVSPAYPVFEVSDCNSTYILYLLNSDIISNEIGKITQGGTRLSLKFSGLKRFVIAIPPLNEQNEISKILEVSEHEIALLLQEIEQIKLQKKGLMQKLLTGKIRVQC